MKRPSPFILFAICTSLLGACGFSSHSESPVEGGNPALATTTFHVRVADRDSSILPGAKVYVWAGRSAIPLDTALADDQGYATVQVPVDSMWSLEARSGTQSGLSHFAGLAESLDSSMLKIGLPTSVSGTWEGGDSKPAWIGILGSPYRSQVDGSGQFILQNIPFGFHLLEQFSEISGIRILASLGLQEQASLKNLILRSPENSILLDDFDDLDTSNIYTPLNAFFPDAHWYSNPPNWTTDSLHTTLALGMLEFRQAISVEVSPFQDTAQQKGCLGLALGNGTQGMAGLDSLTFWAKGPATLRLRFVAPVWGSMEQEIILDSNWKHFSVSPKTSALLGGFATSEEALAATDRLEWIVQDTSRVQFSLDDIRAFGWAP